MNPVDWASRSLATTILAVLVVGGAAIFAATFLKLTVVGAFGLYFVVWWTIVFAVLPIRIRSQADEGEITAGTDPGAPASPALRERAIWTSVAAGIVFLGIVLFVPLAGL